MTESAVDGSANSGNEKLATECAARSKLVVRSLLNIWLLVTATNTHAQLLPSSSCYWPWICSVCPALVCYLLCVYLWNGACVCGTGYGQWLILNGSYFWCEGMGLGSAMVPAWSTSEGLLGKNYVWKLILGISWFSQEFMPKTLTFSDSLLRNQVGLQLLNWKWFYFLDHLTL